MYAYLHQRLPPRLADAVYVIGMAVLISVILLLSAFPEGTLRYARL